MNNDDKRESRGDEPNCDGAAQTREVADERFGKSDTVAFDAGFISVDHARWLKRHHRIQKFRYQLWEIPSHRPCILNERSKHDSLSSCNLV
ncbi:hypothetical protein V6N11_049695 [Hibiscus sabdariffa]|uniref:Transposase IS4-like domain-containing protein n=1 Tax=Hibiscus sabdariffa TaxID=183260 RepID=A0ABR1ZCF6_9ROSI